jgi:hypothetical protein
MDRDDDYARFCALAPGVTPGQLRNDLIDLGARPAAADAQAAELRQRRAADGVNTETGEA